MKHAPIFTVIAACSWAWLLPVCLGAELPLYQRFRPVTELPWRDRSLSMEQVLERIFQAPDVTVRKFLLKEYLCVMPANEFPRAFDICIRLEEDDTPDAILSILLRTWAQVDPEAAWAKCEQLIDTILEFDSLAVDSWSTRIYAVKPAAVRAASYWPQYPHTDDFLEGLKQSDAPEEVIARYTGMAAARDGDYRKAAETARGPHRAGWIQATPSSPEQEAKREYHLSMRLWEEHIEYLTCQRVFSTPPSEIPELLRSGKLPIENGLLAVALIRWMNGDATQGPEVANQYLAMKGKSFKEPMDEYGKSSLDEPLPPAFLVEWFILDKAGYMGFLKRNKDALSSLWQAVGCLDYDPQEGPQYVEWLMDYLGEQATHNPVAFHWSGLDPAEALPWIWNRNGANAYNEFIGDQAYLVGSMLPNIFGAYCRAFEDFVVPVHDDTLYRIMEEWSCNDAVAVAKHGTHWMRRTKFYPRERMIDLYRGRIDPSDGSVDDRHYGALRIWAYRKPDEVRAWIASEDFDDEVKSALHWLVDHAEGGFELPEVQKEDYKESNPVPPADKFFPEEGGFFFQEQGGLR